MNIKKLTEYKSSKDGCYWTLHPNTEDFMNKINEIIDYINRNEEICAALLERMSD